MKSVLAVIGVTPISVVGTTVITPVPGVVVIDATILVGLVLSQPKTSVPESWLVRFML